MSVVYFIRCGVDGPIKVGTAKCAISRLRDLDCGPYPYSLIGTIPGDFKLERRIHCALRFHRERLEWFKPSPVVLSFVEDALGGDAEASLEALEATNSGVLAQIFKRANVAHHLLSAAFRHLGAHHSTIELATVAGKSDDSMRRNISGESRMDIVSLVRLRAAYPAYFTAVEIACNLPESEFLERFGRLESVEAASIALAAFSLEIADLELVEDRSTLERAKDAIDAQLARLGPKERAA